MRLGVVGVLMLLATAISGCGHSNHASSGHAHPIDELAGSYRGVSFGDAKADVIRRLGPSPPLGSNPVIPLKASLEDVDSSTAWNCHAAGLTKSQVLKASSETLRYDYLSVALSNGRVCDLMIIEHGATTRRGVAIGDSLEKARGGYPGIACGTANEGTEYVTYPYCTARLGPRRYVWFGGDPINTIQLNTQAMK